ncbi:2-hydroxyacid dehydrogenase [Microbacterium sp. BR1]|uniref:2-hydroxyacid dehydrogenase n=1 Tax=Microbacterium sp. BR1 TaxID=1070896 RepID=UPI000C2C95B3|nr:D-glycerate dehydrogenase [Microbacterium sp. BR1]
MTPSHVLVTRSLTAAAMSAAQRLLAPLVVLDDAPPDRAELLRSARGAVAIVSLLTEQIDDELFDAAGGQLRIVANVAAGVDNIDLEAAARRGILVSNTPGVLDEATADLALALILATTRRIVEADRFIRSAEQWIWGPKDWVGLQVSAGATVGIVGLGRIGMAVARRAHAFGARIIATGSRSSGPEAAALEVVPVGLDELFETADVVTLHCPLTSETRGMVDAARLKSMRQGSYLINTGRGPLVDEDALADALEEGRLAGAGLDVHENEPLVNERLRRSDRVVLLPHIGSAGAATRDAMGLLAVRNVAEVLAGRRPITPVD